MRVTIEKQEGIICLTDVLFVSDTIGGINCFGNTINIIRVTAKDGDETTFLKSEIEFIKIETDD